MKEQFLIDHPNANWILNCAANDVNWKSALAKLTIDETLYCLERENRSTAVRLLKARARTLRLTPACGARHPHMSGTRCNREDGHPGEHCMQKCTRPKGYDNIWWKET